MATVKLNGKTFKPKAKVQRNPLLVDEKYLGQEPEWPADVDTWAPERRENAIRHAFRYYNYFYNQKDLKKYVVEWLKEGKYLDKEELSAYIRSRDRLTSITACSLVKMHKQGLPFHEREYEFVIQAVRDAIKYSQDSGEDDEALLAEEQKQEAKVKAYVPTIQDRLNEKTAEHIGHFEGLYDEVVQGHMSLPKAYEYLTANNVPQSQIGKFEAVFQQRKAELEEAQAGKCEQLKEAYRHYKAADFKKHIHFLDSILTELEQYRQVKKATKKVRVKKAPSKEKLVSKLKYAKDDKVLKLVSVNPADIIGAQELWVYNVKNRKLGKYVADSIQGPLGVKGTSIIGFDEFKSVCKTLRKPEEKLKEFAKASKVQLRKFLEEIKATETKLNGRINADIVLLRVQ